MYERLRKIVEQKTVIYRYLRTNVSDEITDSEDMHWLAKNFMKE